MARLTFPLGLAAATFLLAAGPALAQFGSIFRDEPPRPPANVPSQPPIGGPSQAPIYRPSPAQQPYYPSEQGQRQLPPPRESRDVPPSQPLPAPMNLPPSSRPGAGGIQSEDLAPPPGTAPSQQPAQTPVQPQQAAPSGPLTVPGRQQQQTNTAPQPGDEIVVAPPPQRLANPTAVFAGLDKITGRIISFDVAINETVQFGALQVTPRVCYSRPPTETSQTDAFVEVDEVTLQGEIKRIFTGWMFAASPGLHAVEHPVYDVWITDCKGGQKPAVAEAADEPKPQPPARGQQQRRNQPARQPQQPQPRAQQQQPGFTPALR